jgi:hypothetical protein
MSMSLENAEHRSLIVRGEMKKAVPRKQSVKGVP